MTYLPIYFRIASGPETQIFFWSSKSEWVCWKHATSYIAKESDVGAIQQRIAILKKVPIEHPHIYFIQI